MTGTVSGSVRLSCSFKTVVSSGTAPILTGQASGDDSQFYAAGAGAGQLNRIYAATGTATAAPASVDLSAVVTADGQVGFSHWRELIVYNDDLTHGLAWDFTAANANTAMFSAGGATAKLTIAPGGLQRFTNPKGAAGYVVDGTHKVVSLDPGANTVSFRVIVAGD